MSWNVRARPGSAAPALTAALLLATLVAAPAPARADLIATELAPASEAPSASAAAALHDRFRDLGLPPQQAQTRLAALSPAELDRVAADPEQVQLGGMRLFGLGDQATTTTALVIGSLFLLAIVLNAIFHFL